MVQCIMCMFMSTTTLRSILSMYVSQVLHKVTYIAK